MSELALKLIQEEQQNPTGELDLGRTGLTEIPKEVFELKHLKTLKLSNNWWDEEKREWISSKNEGSYNKIETLSDEIGQLQGLEWLVVGGGYRENWPLSDISPLRNLTALKRLDLSSNAIENIMPLKQLIKLEALYLQYNELQNLEPLTELNSLTSLDLSSNQVVDIGPVSGLRALTILYLSSNQVVDIGPVSRLRALTSLDLLNNQVVDIGPVSGLSALTILYLSSNQVVDIGPVSRLRALTSLDFRNNQVVDIGPVSGLSALTILDLSYNQVVDIGPVFGLSALTILYLRNNQVVDIGPVSGLGALRSLDLSYNQVVDIGPVSGLSALTSLDLSDNQVVDIGPVSGLGALRSLDLSDNQVVDIGPVSGLGALTSLYLRDNKIQDIRALLPLIQSRIAISALDHVDGINLKQNPLTSPPPEIINQGNEAIINYFESLDQSKASGEGTGSLRELKLILVGEGASGKTSLLKQLQGLEFDPKESQTHGINIARMELKKLPDFRDMKGLDDVVLHGWDFGGQEIMHASHQIFLTKRAIYIYVIDSRNDAKKDYWLQHIQRYGDGSPSLVAINKIDQNKNYDLERSTLNKKYSFLEQRFYRVSCKDGNGLKDLKKAIGELIPNTELYEMKVPVSWVKVKNALEQATDEKNYLSRKQFLKFCKENGVEKKREQNTLLQFLHDLGLVFHFANLKLAGFYVLDPHWVTVAVYKIMNTRAVTDGILKEEQLDYILNLEVLEGEEYDPANKEFDYKPEEQRYIVEIMAEFELLYALEKGQYLIPDLLPKETKGTYQLPAEDCIHFVLAYDFLSQSLFNRLIIDRKEDIQERKWLARNQVVLNNETCTCSAFIQFDLDAKRMDIRVWGKEKRQYLTILRDELNTIHKGFHGLKIEQKLPIPGHEGHYLNYDELIGQERMGEREVKVGVLGKRFPIADFLDPITTIEERRKLKGDMEEEDFRRFININVEQHQHNEQKQQSEQKTEVKTTVSISIQIQNLLGETESLKEEIEDERALLEKEMEPVEIDVAVKKIERAEQDIREIEQLLADPEAIPDKPKNRLSRFMDDLSDEDSPTHKTLKAMRKGKDYAVNLAEMYNGVASNIGMPNVPPAVLGLLKKL